MLSNLSSIPINSGFDGIDSVVTLSLCARNVESKTSKAMFRVPGYIGMLGLFRDSGYTLHFLTVTVYPMLYTYKMYSTVILYNRRKLRDKSVNSGSLNLLNTCN